jgi:Asp-tRNA(Asn)/Glu-tRNA(Gln) amidotransferase A subunit family amidase
MTDWSDQLLRSLLFVPGSDERKLKKVGTFGADAIVIDLEDAVADDLRRLVDAPAARAEVSALELAEGVLERIAALQPVTNAYITVTADLARADARRVDERRARGEQVGPLAGLPVALKDNIDVAGVPGTRGSDWFRDRVPERDAEVARRLRAAGAVIVG